MDIVLLQTKIGDTIDIFIPKKVIENQDWKDSENCPIGTVVNSLIAKDSQTIVGPGQLGVYLRSEKKLTGKTLRAGFVWDIEQETPMIEPDNLKKGITISMRRSN